MGGTMELNHDFSEFIEFFVARDVQFLVVGGYAVADGDVVRIAARKFTQRPAVAKPDAVDLPLVLRGLERVGLILSDLGDRAVRLARHRNPRASIRRSIGIRIDSAPERLVTKRIQPPLRTRISRSGARG